MTVSRALRKQPGVSASEQARIQAVADRMGYRPDPFVTAFLQTTRFNKSRTRKATLGLLVQNSSVLNIARFQRTLRGSQHRAEALGYAIEVFPLDQAELTPQRLAEVLEARGVPGLLVDRVLPTPLAQSFPWNNFACVALNWKLLPQLSSVRHDALHGVTLACGEVSKLGYQRPGLCCDPASDQEVAHAQHAAFLLFQQSLRQKNRLPVLGGMSVKKFQTLARAEGSKNPFLCGIERHRFHQWVQQHQPDIVLSSFRLIADFIASLPPEGIQPPAFVNLNRVGDRTDFAGVDQNHEKIAAAAVNLLARKIELRETGLHDQPDTVIIQGQWHPGISAPSKS